MVEELFAAEPTPPLYHLVLQHRDMRCRAAECRRSQLKKEASDVPQRGRLVVRHDRPSLLRTETTAGVRILYPAVRSPDAIAPPAACWGCIAPSIMLINRVTSVPSSGSTARGRANGDVSWRP